MYYDELWRLSPLQRIEDIPNLTEIQEELDGIIDEIIQKRISNYNFLYKQIIEINNIQILRKSIVNQIPQTFPILLPSKDIRDYSYFHLNECGFGVVSLYHTLIKEIPKNCITELYISDHILNLPIHQDVKLEDLKKLVAKIKLIIKKGGKIKYG